MMNFFFLIIKMNPIKEKLRLGTSVKDYETKKIYEYFHHPTDQIKNLSVTLRSDNTTKDEALVVIPERATDPNPIRHNTYARWILSQKTG